MERLQVYNDVPAIELGAVEQPNEYLAPYLSPPEWNQNWKPIDPDLTARKLFDPYQTDTSAHLANMEKHLLNLTNSAYGCGNASTFQMSDHDSPRLGLTTIWGLGGDARRNMRYMSPHGSRGGSLSSTNSTASDYTFSPDVSSHHASLLHDDGDSNFPLGPHYGLPTAHSQYSYACRAPYVGQSMERLPLGDQAAACTMKELQYTPDLETEDIFEENDCIKIECTGRGKTAPTPESCCLASDASSPSDCGGDMVKDEAEGKSMDSDVDPEYSPTKSKTSRKTCNHKNTRSRAHSRRSLLKPTSSNDRVLKPSQRKVPPKNKSKNMSRGRRGSTNDDPISRPFTCSFAYYGCPSRFSTKNEWKRHVSCQHLQLGVYRCDSGSCNPDLDHQHVRRGSDGRRQYNDFNRKDLFTQHHRRMHTPWQPATTPPSKKANDDFEAGLEEIRQRCWQERRKPPMRSQCIFCARRFEGEAAWEDSMEHIGKHFETAEREKKNLAPGEEDAELRRWALQEGVIVDCGEKRCLLKDLKGSRMAQLSKVRAAGGADDAEEDAVGDDE